MSHTVWDNEAGQPYDHPAFGRAVGLSRVKAEDFRVDAIYRHETRYGRGDLAAHDRYVIQEEK